MVAIQDTELKEGIHQAIERAKELSMPVLLSEIQEMDRIEPLSFFAAGSNRFLGDRFFWKDPANQTVLVGLGICKQIQSDQASDRFFLAEKKWHDFLKHKIIIRHLDIQGTGPMMFGGFSFDPLKGRTDKWSKFPHTLFHIPRYLLTRQNGQTFLTTNIVCTEHDDVSIVDKVVKERQEFLNRKTSSFHDNPIRVEKIEELEVNKWKNTVDTLVKELHKGELNKVVLARELKMSFEEIVSVEGVLNRLLNEQPESFTFAFESNGDCFLGASPERLVKKQGQTLFSTCLAGSIGRGKTEEEDQYLGTVLLSDEKNLIEHQFVVKMIKGAMEQVCSHVDIPSQPVLMKMRDIQHLYTPVEGVAHQESSLLQLVNLLHPTPAMGGFPKEEAVGKIREIEQLDRGFYASPIGWMDFRGNGEFAVAIRSALIQGNEAHLFAGCGIVENSHAESEYIETKIKFRPMLSALGGAKK